MTVRDRGPRVVTMLVTGALLAGWVPDARSDPSPAPDSVALHAEPASDPTVLWTFDSGG